MRSRSRDLALIALGVGLLACRRPIPPELVLPPVEAEDPLPEDVTTLGETLGWMIHGDPLARRVRRVPGTVLVGIDGGEPVANVLEALDRAEQVNRDRGPVLQALEARARGTAGMPLVRGYRLTVAEQVLAASASDPTSPALAALAPLLTSLQPTSGEDPLIRTPLSFLTSDGMGFEEAVRRHGERFVLVGWLDDPSIPLGGVAEALSDGAYSALADTPVGRLVLARGRGASADAAHAWTALERATSLFLLQVSADRDIEQAAWSDRRRAAAEEVGAPDPIRALLEQALRGLTADASDARSAGGAMLAQAALRWIGKCGWPPCADLARTTEMNRAGSWHPDVDRLSGAWRVAALKAAVDGMEVGHDTVVFGRALVDLVDALEGTGGAPVSADLLRRRSADADAWPMLGAAVGEAGVAAWDDLHPSVGAHLRREADRVMPAFDGEDRDLLERISRRAVP